MAMFLMALVIAVVFLSAVATIFFGPIFLGMSSADRAAEAERNKPVPPKAVQAPGFYGWHPSDMALTEDLLLRQIEHHLRREALIAEQFIKNPSPETLRAGEHSLRMH